MSDAAPLPRLGEVFFDVRGNSRSMRLSWYADTGVAVFSIWQAGMCTGTFRLPIGDLSRMIEILERGPSPQGRGRAPVSAGRRGPDGGRGEYPADEDEIGLLDSDGPAAPGGYAGADYTANYSRPGHGPDSGGSMPGYPAADYGSADYGSADYGSADYGSADYGSADYGSAGYRDDGYAQRGYADSGHGGASHGDPGQGGASHGGASHGGASHGGASQGGASQGGASYGGASYGGAGHGGASYGYGETGHHADDYGTSGYQPADYGAGQPDAHESAGYEYDPARSSRGGYAEDDPVRRGGHAGADYAPGGYSAGGPDYLTGEHTAGGYREEMRSDTGADYRSGGYGSQPAFPAGGHRRDDSRLPPDTGGLPSAETDGTGYREERFVPPYVQGGGEPYQNDNRAGAGGYEGDPDYAGYPPDAHEVSPQDGYHEARRRGEAYSYGADYRRR